MTLCKLLDDVLRSAQRKGQDGERGGLIRAIQKNAGIADKEVRHVMCLTEAIRNQMLRVIAHPAGPRLVQAVARGLGLAVALGLPPALSRISRAVCLECSPILGVFSSH